MRRGLGTTGAAVVGLATVAALLAVPGPSSGSTTPVSEAPAGRTLLNWSGFRIDRTGEAAGGFIGARRWGRHGPVHYRIDPEASAGATTYKEGRWVSAVRGTTPRASADRRATARAAWILSKYGTFRYDVQSAAVDAALLHLLADERWSLNGHRGLRRVRQTDAPAQVRSFARTMLHDSVRLSGPYAVEVGQANTALAGDPVDLRIRVVVARNGRPLPFVPVRVTSPDGSADVGTTDEGGWVRVTYEHPSVGATPIRVRVGNTPETRLRMLNPARPSRSRVVVAGRKGPVQGQGAVYVKAHPRVVVLDRVKRIRAGAPTRGGFRLVGSAEAWTRRAVVTLHGPFAHADKARCGDRVVRKGRVRVTDAGTYTLPRFTLREEGFFVWRVRVPGNAVNLSAADCGGRFRVLPR